MNVSIRDKLSHFGGAKGLRTLSRFHACSNDSSSCRDCRSFGFLRATLERAAKSDFSSYYISLPHFKLGIIEGNE